MVQSFSKVTVYYLTEVPISPIGFAKLEASVLEYHGDRSFYYKQVRQRSWRTFHNRPPFVMLEGWGHPPPPPIWIINGQGLRTNRYIVTNHEYFDDFNTFLDDYLLVSGAQVLVDMRDNVSPSDCSSSSIPGLLGIEESGAISPQVEMEANSDEEEVPLFEGARHDEFTNVYERNVEARRQCLAHYGRVCQACKANLIKIYGVLGSNIIQVHHLKPLSEIGESYIVDPINDLIPVCPNCHAMMHQRTPPFSMSEIQSILLSAQASSAGSSL